MDYVEEPLWRIRLDGDVVFVSEAQLFDLRKRRGEAPGAAALEAEDDDSEEETDEQSSDEGDDAGEELASTGKKKPIRRLDSAPIPAGTVILRPGLGASNRARTTLTAPSLNTWCAAPSIRWRKTNARRRS